MNQPVYAIQYARSATEDLLRIAEQVRLFRDFARARGWIIVGEYADCGWSGIGRDNRPGFRKMMSALRSGNVLLVEEVFRLSRKFDVIDICRELRARGVRVMISDGRFDPAEPQCRPFIYLGEALHGSFHERSTRTLRRLRTLRLRLGQRGGGN